MHLDYHECDERPVACSISLQFTGKWNDDVDDPKLVCQETQKTDETLGQSMNTLYPSLETHALQSQSLDVT